MSTLSRFVKLGLVTTFAVAASACESSGSYRLSSVGSVPDNSDVASTSSTGDGSSGGTGSSSGGGSGSGSGSSSGGNSTLGSGLLVTAGNTVIGVAGKQAVLTDRLGNALPITTPVTGIVTRVLTKTGQTLVDIGNGNSLVLGKAGGKIGDLLKIDIGSKTVIGAPNGSPLLGVGVLSPAGSGNIATATVGQTVNVVAGVTQPLTTTVNGTVTPQTGTTGGATNGLGGVVTKTTGAVGGLLGGLTPKK